MRNLIFKKLFMSLFLICGVTMMLKAQDPKMIVELKSGILVEKELSNMSKLCVSGGDLSIVYVKLPQESYSTSEIKKIYFKNIASTASLDSELIKDTEVYLSPDFNTLIIESPKNTSVDIYALNGVKVMSDNITAGEARIDIMSLKEGFYIVKAGNHTTKICKR